MSSRYIKPNGDPDEGPDMPDDEEVEESTEASMAARIDSGAPIFFALFIMLLGSCCLASFAIWIMAGLWKDILAWT